MSSMNYQKVYMNQIHSSSLLCQLSHMWKGQMLCDAIIKTGQVITKAHRVVLVAACPMLQSMENASAGSHLEVRLAADIKQESVNTFLQYLYEGFMMLTEENVRDVEKVGRLLQVDSVIKCCADFYKCMNAKTGAPFPGSSYKYSFSGHDLAEFRHVRATGLQKTASERIIKRVSDFPRPGSPGSKRPRLYRGGSPSDVTVIGSDKADDTASMSHSYMSGAPDPWDRVPKLGSGMSRQGATGRNSQPGVIEIIEERIELVQTEPPEKDSGQPSSSRSSQKSAAVSIAVTSQFNTEPDISVVNVFGSPETQSTTAASNAITSSSSSRGSITVSPLTIFQEPHPQSSSAPEPSSSSSTVESSGQVSEIQFAGFSQRQDVVDSVYGMGKQQKSVDSQLTSTPHQRPFPVSVSPITQPKPFAAGSAVQAGISSPSSMSLPLGSPSSSKSVQKPRSAPASPAERARDSRRASEAAGMHSTADMTPDLSIVKIESSNHETGGLDMHVDMPEEGVMRIHPGRMPDEQEEASDKEIEDWAREEMSNEGSNISGDQNNSWYMGTFKGTASCSEDQSYSPGEDAAPNYVFLDTGDMQTVQWALKLFRGFLVSLNLSVDFEAFPPSQLNDCLSKFYLEAKSKRGEMYHVSTLTDVRNSIMRYLSNLTPEWKSHIKHSDVFQPSNNLLDNLRESLTETPMKPKAPMKIPMTSSDVGLLISSGCLNLETPLGLFRKVWYDLTLHLGCGGQSALRGLTQDSFVLETDEKGRKFYRLNHSIKIQRARSCMEMQYWNWDGRMYEIVGNPMCPVKSMDKYLSKRNPNKDAFFQRPKGHVHPTDMVWYESPVGHGVLACLMSKMAEDACLSRTYTNSSIRVTIADLLERKGYSVETTMGMDPRNKSTKSLPTFSNVKADDLHANSALIHKIMYHCDTD
ncbi:uncharacterized protein LOC110459952 isoform X3 [Mizuhopecten yessoensis]|uniref:uncharacterized protein LOC110459952 isoform X3 n=1 Tax=Mizuhopecten yessoensis TaxID=6573 RepID=UPI000B458AC9|nr:uncharacterized protein LOC110459952 isoform X3 [Mizuhopecten yessoensis]